MWVAFLGVPEEETAVWEGLELVVLVLVAELVVDVLYEGR